MTVDPVRGLVEALQHRLSGAALEAAGVNGADTLSDPILSPPASAPPEGWADSVTENGVDMGSPKAAAEALAAATVKWREYRQPMVGTAAILKKHEAAEKEAQFRLSNAALLWLWHHERSAAPPPPAGVDLPETEGEAARAREAAARVIDPWAWNTAPTSSDHLEARDASLAKADQIIALLAQQKERG